MSSFPTQRGRDQFFAIMIALAVCMIPWVIEELVTTFRSLHDLASRVPAQTSDCVRAHTYPKEKRRLFTLQFSNCTSRCPCLPTCACLASFMNDTMNRCTLSRRCMRTKYTRERLRTRHSQGTQPQGDIDALTHTFRDLVELFVTKKSFLPAARSFSRIAGTPSITCTRARERAWEV